MKTIYKFLVLAMLSNSSAEAQPNPTNETTKTKEVTMTIVEQNKELVRKLYEQSLNGRNMELLDELVSSDYVGLRGLKGAAAFKEPVTSLMNAFPDVQWKIEDMIGEGDKVVVVQLVQGTHQEQFQHIRATGKTISNNGIGIYEVKNGKIINYQVYTDRLGFLQQLEVLPTDLTQLGPKK